MRYCPRCHCPLVRGFPFCPTCAARVPREEDAIGRHRDLDGKIRQTLRRAGFHGSNMYGPRIMQDHFNTSPLSGRWYPEIAVSVSHFASLPEGEEYDINDLEQGQRQADKAEAACKEYARVLQRAGFLVRWSDSSSAVGRPGVQRRHLIVSEKSR